MVEHFAPTERRHEYEQLLTRLPDNPILKPKHWRYAVNAVFNPGAARLQDTGEVLLLVRGEGRRGHSHLYAARSPDGIANRVIDSEPTMMADREARPEELRAVKDPRINCERVGDVGDVVFPCGTVLDNDGDTLLVYYGAADTSVCLATTSVRELLE
jgi:predicted GH43/DUF377 family glycosyl hydrolase